MVLIPQNSVSVMYNFEEGGPYSKCLEANLAGQYPEPNSMTMDLISM